MSTGWVHTAVCSKLGRHCADSGAVPHAHEAHKFCTPACTCAEHCLASGHPCGPSMATSGPGIAPLQFFTCKLQSLGQCFSQYSDTPACHRDPAFSFCVCACSRASFQADTAPLASCWTQGTTDTPCKALALVPSPVVTTTTISQGVDHGKKRSLKVRRVSLVTMGKGGYGDSALNSVYIRNHDKNPLHARAHIWPHTSTCACSKPTPPSRSCRRRPPLSK